MNKNTNMTEPIGIKCRQIILNYLTTNEGKKAVIKHFKKTHFKTI